MVLQYFTSHKNSTLLDRYGLAAGIIIGVSILLAAYFFLIAPLVTELRSEATSKRAAKQEELVQTQNRVRSLQAIRDKLEDITPAELTRMETLLPDSANVPMLLQDMDRMVRESGMSVASMSIVEAAVATSAATGDEASVRATPNASVHPVDVQLSLNTGGDYASFKNLLSVIEAHNPYVEMNSLTFQTGSQQLSLALRTYYYQ